MSSNKERYIQVENKNAVLELLLADIPFVKIMIANNAFRDPKTKKIIAEANKRKVPLEKITRKQLNNRSRTSSCESIIGLKLAPKEISLDTIIEKSRLSSKPLLVVILNNVQYAQNIGALLRTAYASGVDAVIISKRKNLYLTDEVTRISMGASEQIPVIQMNLFEAIRKLKEADVRIVGVHMEGKPYHELNLKGDLTLVFGSEDEGVSSRILSRCDDIASIPMQDGLGSLNVGAAGAILMFEKKKQDST
jgi:23S rRNA (guanosine2251-2'-O)-methyltransferase